MERDFFDPPWEQTTIVLIDTVTLQKAEQRFLSCEVCNPNDAEIPFDHILDDITGHDPSVTDYLLAKPAHCPRCQHEVREKTLVEWSPDDGQDAGVPAPQAFARH